MGEGALFTMPSLGADMDAGTLVAWQIAPGQRVHRGQVVAVVETQKGAIEIEIWQDGLVEALLVDVGATVPVGSALARLAPADGAPAARPEANEPPARTRGEPRPPAAPAPSPPLPPAGAWIRSAPAARRRAIELGLSLSEVTGTGPHGAVTRSDVERAAQARAAAERPRTASREEARRAMREAIAGAMARSKREIPHYYLSHHIDASAALARVEELNRERPIEQRLLPVALFVRAIALSLAEHRELNGYFVEGQARLSPAVHLGVAIALRGGGLVVPALHDADTRSLDEVMAGIKDLTARARAGRLRSSELSDATATMTALGDQGVETVFGVIYPPQLAIIGLGKVVERPWAVGGMLGVRPVLHITLAADHRASDGHLGGLFLSSIERRLAAPEAL